MINEPIILFDGVCNLCNGSVAWIIRRDRRGRFRFASQQSEFGQALLAREWKGSPKDSMALCQNGVVFAKSDAVLRIARGLPLPWRCAALLLLVPRPIRDAAYDFVAKRRYRWFGKRESCMVPTPELAARFVERA